MEICGVRRSWAALACGIAAALAFAARPAVAWNEAGHEVIAEIAWERMSPAERDAAMALLKAHPFYERDLLDPSVDLADRPESVFLAASNWPDRIVAGLDEGKLHPFYAWSARQWGFDPKSKKELERYAAALRTWHYIDLPVSRGGYKGDLTHPLLMEYSEKDRSMPETGVQALRWALLELRREKDPARRAVALCWVLHLVGDLHQPLHCAELWSPETPHGDRGGNRVWIRYYGHPTRLHAYWDRLLGKDTRLSAIRRKARSIDAANPKSAFATADSPTDLDVEHWVLRSRRIADTVAYDLPEIVTSRDSDALSSLSRRYREEARRVACARAELAGLRLRNLLRRVLRP